MISVPRGPSECVRPDGGEEAKPDSPLGGAPEGTLDVAPDDTPDKDRLPLAAWEGCNPLGPAPAGANKHLIVFSCYLYMKHFRLHIYGHYLIMQQQEFLIDPNKIADASWLIYFKYLYQITGSKRQCKTHMDMKEDLDLIDMMFVLRSFTELILVLHL